ncbi:MAG: tannase/feruloyl esterase family alpha/beta hydrolase [Oricola sp.]|nr:tannase/feruloyl esterase family alpha/beta hydrolase [Oricola sp.]
MARAAAGGVFLLCGAALAEEEGAACASLKDIRLADVEIAVATAVSPDPVWKIQHPYGRGDIDVDKAFCRIEGSIEGNIGFEVWLPEKSAWTGRMLGAGVGGSAGHFNYVDMARGLRLGFAGATTDAGHKMDDKGWMLDAKIAEDFTHRAQHLTAVAAKKIIAAYYGDEADYSYFIGCSGGGRQALKEMQLYPSDYDGVISGAPGPNNPVLSARHLVTALRQQANPEGSLANEDWQLVEDHVAAVCDANDGLKDGLVENPKACRFDFADLRCDSDKSDACLTDAQIEMAEAIYAPLEDENGKAVDKGLLAGLRARPGPAPSLILEMFGQGVHNDPDWDPQGFRVSEDVTALHKLMPDMRADNPDVAAFRDRGGKIILYHGWWDSSVLAQQTIDYLASVRAKLGGDVSGFMRLFMAPGVYHCSGGPGADDFGGFMKPPAVEDAEHDMLRALVKWVEEGDAPERIVATKIGDDGETRFSRPLCAFPQSARYREGDPDDAASFDCVADPVLERDL